GAVGVANAAGRSRRRGCREGNGRGGAEARTVPAAQVPEAGPRGLPPTSDSGTTLATLRHDHLTKRLQAVRKGRFGILQAKLAEPGPQIGEALVQVAKILHPEAFR